MSETETETKEKIDSAEESQGDSAGHDGIVPPGEEEGGARILSQEEIDSLLGFEDDAGAV